MLRADANSPHEVFYYYRIRQLQAVRSGRWKLHVGRLDPTSEGDPNRDDPNATRVKPRLYDLEHDIAERNDVAAEHPDVVARLEQLANRARSDIGDGRLPGADEQVGRHRRPAGYVTTAVPLTLRSAPSDSAESPSTR